MTVPNKFPLTEEVPYRIALIGEAPGADEVEQGEPFVGQSGRLLNALLSRANILRTACFLGNIVQHRPPNNDITKFDPSGPEFAAGREQLQADLVKYNPNLCVLFGNTPLSAFKGGTIGVSHWRGSLFEGSLVPPAPVYKCLSAYHPANCLPNRDPDSLPLLLLDLKRARTEGLTRELSFPVREFELDLDANALVDRLLSIPHGTLLSVDIEGWVSGISCISFSTTPYTGFIVPFTGAFGASHWATAEEELRVWQAVKTVLENPSIPKLLQNSNYDRFVLAWTYGILIRNVQEDTLLEHWEAYCELDKDLGTQCSIYTKEPYYKADRKSDDVRTHRAYCCKDSAVTLEIHQRLVNAKEIDAGGRAHYRFNVRPMLDIIQYMQQRGIRFDRTLRDSKVSRLAEEVGKAQAALDARNGGPFNIKSAPQKKAFLYEKLGLPPQYVGRGETRRVTTNDEAILKLYKKSDDPMLQLLVRTIRKRTRMSKLSMGVDPDGRVRCSYNQLSKAENKEEGGGMTSTGRMACSKSLTGSGDNLQTIPDEDRDMFLADAGCYMGQCDLSGADAWTVACHCSRLGDDRMLNDLLAGVKIAKVITYMFRNPGAPLPSDPKELAELVNKEVKKKDPLYLGGKQAQHASNYFAKPTTVQKRCFIESDGEINLDLRTCERLQEVYFSRYIGVPRWHRWVRSELQTKRELRHASGHVRHFLGNPFDDDTLRKALADEPQGNTTFTTNRAAARLWSDPDNLRNGRLVVEPLHQVHDALVTQWLGSDTEFAVRKHREWFNNPITIAGITITIPYSGQYGSNWYEAGDDDTNPRKL